MSLPNKCNLILNTVNYLLPWFFSRILFDHLAVHVIKAGGHTNSQNATEQPFLEENQESSLKRKFEFPIDPKRQKLSSAESSHFQTKSELELTDNKQNSQENPDYSQSGSSQSTNGQLMTGRLPNGDLALVIPVGQSATVQPISDLNALNFLPFSPFGAMNPFSTLVPFTHLNNFAQVAQVPPPAHSQISPNNGNNGNSTGAGTSSAANGLSLLLQLLATMSQAGVAKH